MLAPAELFHQEAQATGATTLPLTGSLPLGFYALKSRIASGVFLAKKLGSDETVALKRLSSNSVKEKVQGYLIEAGLQGVLEHKHLVRFRGVGVARGEYYLAMDYLKGADFRTIIDFSHGRPMPLDVVIAIIVRAAAALEHARGACAALGDEQLIVRPQVSAGNIVVGYDGSVIVADYGIAGARVPGEHSVSLESADPMIDYANQKPASVGLAALAWELVSGERLQSRSMANKGLCLVSSCSSLRDEVPKVLEYIILAGILKGRDGSYQQSNAFSSRLLQFANKYELDLSDQRIAQFMAQTFKHKTECTQDVVVASEAALPLAADVKPVAEVMPVPRFDLPEGTSAPATLISAFAKRGSVQFFAEDVSLWRFDMTQPDSGNETAAPPSETIVDSIGRFGWKAWVFLLVSAFLLGVAVSLVPIPIDGGGRLGTDLAATTGLKGR